MNQLYDTYHALGPDVIALNVVPFGNARLDASRQAVQCQHGPGECDANAWEQCAVEHVPAPVYVEFLECLERRLPMGFAADVFPEELFLSCAVAVDGMDAHALKKCHDNPMLRWQLQEKYAKATPEHDYVPWIVVNGKKMEEETENLLDVVCKEYTNAGGMAPPACSSAAMIRELN